LKYLEYKNKYLALKGGMVGGMNERDCEELLKKEELKNYTLWFLIFLVKT
jgi:hypothetical protein